MPSLIRQPSGPALVDRPPRPPGPGEVQLRVRLAGVCRTDVAAAAGGLGVRPGVVLGHELAGEVVALGPGSPAALLGQRATAHPRGQDGLFLGLHRDGAYGPYLTLPAAQVWPAPPDMDLRRLAFVEPAAAALAVGRAPLRPGDRVGLTGSGRIAELTRRALLHLGIIPLPAGADGPLDALVHTAAGGLPDLSRLRRGGLVVLKSRPAAPVPVDLRAVVERELRLVGVEYAPFAEVIGALHTGDLPVDDLLGPTLPLARWARAFAADEGQKLFLDPGDPDRGDPDPGDADPGDPDRGDPDPGDPGPRER